MSGITYKEKREHTLKLQKYLVDSGQLPTCTNCEAWDKTQEICKEYKARPPADVIVVGCVEHEAEIPF